MPLKILIVDDEDTIRSFLALAVRALKFEPVLADCGEKALELFAAERPDLVLLDVQLPDIDGFDVASRLTNGNGPHIVLVSSRDSSDFGPLVARSGARGFVPKAELSGARIHELL